MKKFSVYVIGFSDDGTEYIADSFLGIETRKEAIALKRELLDGPNGGDGVWTGCDVYVKIREEEYNDGTEYFLADDGEISLNEYNQMITLLHGIVTGKASEYYHEYIVDHVETDHCKLLAKECGILEKVKGIIEKMRKADYGIETTADYWNAIEEDSEDD